MSVDVLEMVVKGNLWVPMTRNFIGCPWLSLVPRESQWLSKVSLVVPCL